MFDWLFGKKVTEKIKEDTKQGFDSVKKDIHSVAGWIRHLDSEKEIHKKDISELREEISTIKEDVEEIKNTISLMGKINPRQVFKTPKQLLDKQTGVYAVQTGVQTGVQTPNLDQFSVSERAIVWVLLNTDMKLSYDDVAAVLGKERTTVRGQINAIKQKSEGVIEEVIEKNGKKRVFIPEEIREKLRKKPKVRVKRNKK